MSEIKIADKTNVDDIQVIGADFGRGFVKGYSKVNGKEYKTVFKSIIGDGRNIDLSDYEEPIYIKHDNKDLFIGVLAEKESQVQIRNSKDSKTSNTVKTLMAAMLSEIAVKDTVKIMMGVPYKNYRKTVLKEVIETYKGKTIEVKNNLTGATKRVTISDISIFRESDAAAYHVLGGEINYDKPVGLASIGFRTTELSYFDKGFKFNDKRSKTIEFGNRSLLTIVQEELERNEIMKELTEIDTSTDYDSYKKAAYTLGSENITQRIEDIWINTNEMDVYIAGGTSLNLTFDDEFKVVEEPQMATAKGLFDIGERRL